MSTGTSATAALLSSSSPSKAYMQKISLVDVLPSVADASVACMSILSFMFSMLHFGKWHYVKMSGFVAMYAAFEVTSVVFLASSSAYMSVMRVLKHRAEAGSVKVPDKAKLIAAAGSDVLRAQRFVVATVVYGVALAWVSSVYWSTNESFRAEVDNGFRSYGASSLAEKLYVVLLYMGIFQLAIQLVLVIGQQVWSSMYSQDWDETE